MKKANFKIFTGYDSFFTISSDELHKAYYLYLHPEKRTIFKNGNAIEGSMIKRIEPDYHSMLGYNPSHKLDGDDWNEIKSNELVSLGRVYMQKATDVAKLIDKEPDLWNLPLGEIETKKIGGGFDDDIDSLANKFKLN
jgi:hypothetical protein